MGAVAAPAIHAGFLEPRWLELSHVPCRLPKLVTPLRVLHLSDLHSSPVVPKSQIERAIDMGIESRPDFACLTGDFVTNGDPFDADWYLAVLKRLSARTPCFAVMGNHDGGYWAAVNGGLRSVVEISELLKRAGISTLHNRSVRVEFRGQELHLVGVGDLWSREVRPVPAFDPAPPADAPIILLSHNPDSKMYLAEYPWHLMLCGHTHGGQIRIPVVGAPFAPVADRAYIAGLKPWEDRQIYVTRGVGNVHGVRFNCRPEVSVLELRPVTA
jgi:hypothetical protein